MLMLIKALYSESMPTYHSSAANIAVITAVCRIKRVIRREFNWFPHFFRVVTGFTLASPLNLLWERSVVLSMKVRKQQHA